MAYDAERRQSRPVELMLAALDWGWGCVGGSRVRRWKGTRLRIATALGALGTFAFQRLASFVSCGSMGWRGPLVQHCEPACVRRYLVLYDHDFELLWSAAPVPGTGTGRLAQ